MPGSTTVIYHAANPQQATILKDRLLDEGIEALVVNDYMQGVIGLVPLGWTSLAQVVVSHDDAPRARQIAMAFDRRLADAARAGRSWVAEDTSPAADPTWITVPEPCPICGAARAAVCPLCSETRSDFPLANTPELAVGSGEPAMPTFLCRTCNEPFEPGYARNCPECGHDFGDGVVLPGTIRQQDVEPVNMRAVALMLGIVALVGALVAYFAYILAVAGRAD